MKKKLSNITKKIVCFVCVVRFSRVFKELIIWCFIFFYSTNKSKMGGNKRILKRKQSFKNIEKTVAKETNDDDNNSDESSVSK